MFPDRRTRSFLDTGVLSRLAGFPLFARGRCMGSVSGRHPSPHRGSSVEFAEYRKYVPGDDLRRLDWRAYGRSDRFFVKEFEADTNLRCCLVLDTSGSMDFGTTGVTKIEYARQDRRGDRAPGAPAGGRGRPDLRRRRDRPQHPAAAEPLAPDGGLRRPRAGQAAGRDPARPGAPRAGRDDPPARADRHPLRPVRRARGAALAASSTCGSASTTWPSSTCSTPRR